MNKTLDQRRAKHAWDSIISLKSNGKYGTDAEEYARETKKMPVRVMASGLGQALAFISAKAAKKEGLKRLNEHLTDWILNKRPISSEFKDLMQSIIHGDSDFLRRVTDEAMAYLQWLNRFSEAEGLAKDTEN